MINNTTNNQPIPSNLSKDSGDQERTLETKSDDKFEFSKTEQIFISIAENTADKKIKEYIKGDDFKVLRQELPVLSFKTHRDELPRHAISTDIVV